MLSERKSAMEEIIRRCGMGTLITMIYTAAITIIAVEVVEHTPGEKNK